MQNAPYDYVDLSGEAPGKKFYVDCAALLLKASVYLLGITNPDLAESEVFEKLQECGNDAVEYRVEDQEAYEEAMRELRKGRTVWNSLSTATELGLEEEGGEEIIG